MTRMAGLDCVVVCNLINTHTHYTHTPVFVRSIIDPSLGGPINNASVA